MRNPKPINQPKPNRRKTGAHKLEPIDWHEFANDAVLNGNMSTLFRRPPTEDPTTYASPEALVEIEKRAPRPAAPPSEAMGTSPTVGSLPAERPAIVGTTIPAEEAGRNKKIKPIRSVHDGLTLAGQILYNAMYGAPQAAEPRQCSKGYRQLAAETRLDKDTVRDLIAEFKSKGILREIGSYNPDTRSSKTYEVLSSEAIVAMWKNAGFTLVTTGRQRPELCTTTGKPQ